MHILDLSTFPGLVQIAKRTAFIRQGSYQIVHLNDINKVGQIISEIKNISEKVRKANRFKSILSSKTLHLSQKILDEIKPHYRFRRSWEWLGSSNQWMTGNPDEDDLRSMNSDINTMTSNHNKVVKENNMQIEMNKVFEDRIILISETLSKTVASYLNKTSEALDILNLILNIDLDTEKLEVIKNAFKLVKINVIKRILSEQGFLIP